jgi:hypothetical protein
LAKINKENGQVEFAKTVLDRCSGPCFYVADFKNYEDDLYVLAAYRFWSNESQYLIKVSKDGELKWISKYRLCSNYDCVNTAVSLAEDERAVIAIGHYDNDRTEVNGFYALSFDKEGGFGQEGIVKKASPDEVDFGREYELELEEVDASLVEVKNYPVSDLLVSPKLEIVASPFVLGSISP